MQIHKYKGWHTTQQKMYSPEEMAKDQLTLMPDGSGFINVHGGSTQLSTHIESMIPLKYTNLKDMHSTEIYEGDIYHWLAIEYKTGKVVVDQMLEVYFDEDCPGYYVNLDGMQERLFARRTKNNAIVGNIYENPELIKD